MPRVTSVDHVRDGRRFCLRVGCLWGLILGGCSAAALREPQPGPNAPDANRRMQLWEIGTVGTPTEHPRTQPSGTPVPATRPVDGQDPLAPPYRLDAENIVRLTYRKSPLVTSSREQMQAAQYGLTEFKANLSRFEPFLETTGDMTDFPERRDSEGVSGEVIGGIQKETFDGAIIRLEGGMSGGRVEFGEVAEDQEEIEEGSGGLIRARIEIPFAGSRKRQERVISQAFQESSARKAILNYLTNYRSYVASALSYYQSTVYYLDYMRAYQRKLERLERLLEDPRVKPEDRSRIQSTVGDTKVTIDSYRQSYRTYLLLLLQYAGVHPDEEFVLAEPPPDAPSRYYERTLTPEGRQRLLAEAYENNPRFRVLEDAIRDSQLKRTQAIRGSYDVTAFGEGTEFGFGSETYDDRVGGWQANAGVTFRLNDRRVLTASQKKAEAEIRGFRAQIEAEQLSVQRQIATQSNVLRSRIESRPQILRNIEETQAQVEERSRLYLSGESETLTIDDVLTSLGLLSNAECRLIGNVYYSALAEDRLLSATGGVYRLVGLRMVDNGNGVELAAEE